VSRAPDYSTPISAEAPCGRDLDADHDYTMLMMAIETYLPERYAGFQRNGTKEADLIARITDRLEDSRDLGLLTGLARLQILRGDVHAFERTIAQIAGLLKEHWDDVYPRCPNGDPTRRLNTLTTLVNNRAHVAIPLENLPLVQTDRGTAVTWKAWVAERGATAQIEGGQPSALAAAFAKANPEELQRLAECLQRLAAASAEIENTVSVRSGGKGRVDLAKLREPVAAIVKLIQEQAGLHMPPPPPAEASLAAAAGEATEPVSDGPAIGSWLDARRRLGAVIDYYCEFEPANPALILARQAQALFGLDLTELLSLLVPDKLAKARFALASRPAPASERKTSVPT